MSNDHKTVLYLAIGILIACTLLRGVRNLIRGQLRRDALQKMGARMDLLAWVTKTRHLDEVAAWRSCKPEWALWYLGATQQSWNRVWRKMLRDIFSLMPPSDLRGTMLHVLSLNYWLGPKDGDGQAVLWVKQLYSAKSPILRANVSLNLCQYLLVDAGVDPRKIMECILKCYPEPPQPELADKE